MAKTVEISFDKFDENDYSITISLAEYRHLISENTILSMEDVELRDRIESLETQNDVLKKQLALASQAVEKTAFEEPKPA